MINEYGYEYDATHVEPLWTQTKGLVTRNTWMGAICLRSGRDALKAIAREYSPTVVLLSALSCDSMSVPFELYHYKIGYYKLNRDYSINIESLESLIPTDCRPVLFLYMDYFGNPAIHDDDLERLKSKYSRMVFIEDRTHNLLLERKSKFQPEFVMASLRKWVAVPDGGLLWARKPLVNTVFSENTSFSEMRLNAQCLRNRFLQCGEQSLKTEFRHIFSTVTDTIDTNPVPGRMSEYAYQLACKTDFHSIKETRASNAKTLIEELRSLPISFIQSKPGTGDVYVAILADKRNELQRRLSAMGIFCTIIWPLCEEQKSSCPVAKYTEEHMLAIYCDQRYSTDDMKYIASNIKRIYYE